MKRIKFFITVILIIVLLCGCMPKTSLQDRAIVLAMGIDYLDNNYRVTIQKFSPSKNAYEENSGEESVISTSTGKTLFEALKNAQADDGKEIFYGHSRVYIIGKNAAKMGLKPVLEFMNSNYQISLNSLVITTENTAEYILKSEGFTQNAPDISMEIIEESGKAVDCSVIDTLTSANNLKGTFVLSVIKESHDNGIMIENAVVFNNAKPQLTLNSEQTMGYNFIKGKVNDAVIVVGGKNEGETISVNVSLKNVKNSIKLENGEIYFCVYINSTGNISEKGVSQEKEINSDYINMIENKVEEKIFTQIMSVLKTLVTDNKCDAFYIENMIKNKDLEFYKKISEQPKEIWLPTVKFDIKVDFDITHLGVQVK